MPAMSERGAASSGRKIDASSLVTFSSNMESPRPMGMATSHFPRAHSGRCGQAASLAFQS
jgi:hypothetical protein